MRSDSHFPPSSKRMHTCQSLLANYQSQRVLLLGIGGGGDIIGTLPTYFDLKRLGGEPILGGLSWKRIVHDPEGRPRAIKEFQNIEQFNDCVGLVTADTNLGNGIQHVEADLARLFPDTQIITIDISQGVAKTRLGIAEYLKANDIREVIAIDAGGDALVLGNEPTIRSPLCDQVMLATLSNLSNCLLGVIGLGSDGELSMDSFVGRFQSLQQLGAYRGALEVDPSDVGRLLNILQEAKTESSSFPIKIAAELPGATIRKAHELMNATIPKPDYLLAEIKQIALRNGTRTAELSPLTAFTLFFDLPTVYTTNLFYKFVDENLDINELNTLFISHGYVTEFTDRPASVADFSPQSPIN